MKSSDIEPIRSEEDRKEIQYIIYVISPLCFHLNRVGNGNDDISPEENFEHSKTSSGSYLGL
jgi:hypothetical protein